jgi:hypothetical protein
MSLVERWQSVATFPCHFHDGSEDFVSASHISQNPEEALRQFLVFVREKLGTSS